MPDKLIFNSGEIEWLPIGMLNVDHRYQRPGIRTWAKEIAENFDPDLFGFLVVNQRKDGTYWVIDGQQRRAALLDHLKWGDDQLVPCLVNHRDGAINEAKAFNGINTDRRVVRAVDSFFARVVAGEKTATDVKKIIEEVGLEISRGSRDGCIAATKACEFVYHGAKEEKKPGAHPWLLRDTLQTIIGAWGDSREALTAMMIKAVGQILRHVPKIDRVRLMTAMSKYPAGPPGLWTDARAKARSDMMSSLTAIADLIITRYNMGLRTNKIPLWRDVIRKRT